MVVVVVVVVLVVMVVVMMVVVVVVVCAYIICWVHTCILIVVKHTFYVWIPLQTNKIRKIIFGTVISVYANYWILILELIARLSLGEGNQATIILFI